MQYTYTLHIQSWIQYTYNMKITVGSVIILTVVCVYERTKVICIASTKNLELYEKFFKCLC